MVQRKWILKEGVVLRPYGANSLIDNSNLTDSMAEMLIKKNKANLSDFITIKKQKNGNNK